MGKAHGRESLPGGGLNGRKVLASDAMKTLGHFVRELPGLRRIPGIGIKHVVIRSLKEHPRTFVADKGYGFGPYPNGWFQIAWSHELRPGEVKPVRCLGRELVLFRGQDGRAHVLDAYCPHLGAHLGIGGTVVGNDVRCPFHGWQFNGEGTCTLVPGARKIPPKAQVPCWTVQESSGCIFLWHDAEQRPPWFEIPPVPEYGTSEWSRPQHIAYQIRTRWRDLLENAIDRAHFHTVHGYPEPPDLALETSGPSYIMRSKVHWRRFGRDMDVLLENRGHGPGITINRGVAEARWLVLGCPVPVDENTVILRMTVMVSADVPAPLRAFITRVFLYFIRNEVERDLPIWENKIDRPSPVLADCDGPIARFRSWSRQFYSASPASAQ